MSPNFNTKNASFAFDLPTAKLILWRYWYWLLISTALLLTVGFVYLRYTKQIYQSSAIIQIQEEDKGSEILDLGDSKAKKAMSANIEFLKSPLLFSKAIEQLPLSVTFFNRGNILSNQIYGQNIEYDSLKILDNGIIGVSINLSESNGDFKIDYQYGLKDYEYILKTGKKLITPQFELKFINADELRQLLSENNVYFIIRSTETLSNSMIESMKITPLNQDAQTIEISYQSNNAALSKDVVDAIINQFFVFDELVKKQSSENVIGFLNNQLDSLAKELRKSRDSIIYFQQRNKINDPNSVADQLVQKVDDIDDKTYQAKNNLDELKSIRLRINNTTTESTLEDILIEILNSEYTPAIIDQIKELQDLISNRNKLLTKVQSSNTEAIAANKRIQQKVNDVRKSINFIEQKYQRIYNDLAVRKAQLEGEYLQIPEKKMEFSKLTSTEELYDKYYSMLMDKRAQYAITNAGYQPGGRVLRAATINAVPISPNVSAVYTICTILGLALGFFALFIKTLAHNRIESTDDIKRMLGEQASVLGELPQLVMDSKYSQIKIEKNRNTHIGEILRGVRSNLNFISPNYKTIAVTSTIPGEGKTFVTLNLATVIALSDKKTVVLDLDLRKPKIHLAFNVTNNHGVSDYLINQVELENCIRKTNYDNLDVITSGTIPPNPSELLLSPQFNKMLEELSKIYDVVIMDTSPVGIVTDGLSILSKVDVPIYVFRSNYSKREFVNRTREVLNLLKLRSINIIVNGVDFKEKPRYGSYKSYNAKSYYIDEQ